MKNKKAFTLIELFICVTIVAIIIGVVSIGFFGATGASSGGPINPWFFPKQARAQAQQEQADAYNRLAAAQEEANRIAAQKAGQTNQAPGQ